MTRTGPGLAASMETVPIRGVEASALIVLELDTRGELVNLSVKAAPPEAETAAQRAARELAQGVASRVRQMGLALALERARQALDLLENLEALEQLRGPEARALLAGQGPAA